MKNLEHLTKNLEYFTKNEKLINKAKLLIYKLNNIFGWEISDVMLMSFIPFISSIINAESIEQQKDKMEVSKELKERFWKAVDAGL